MTAGRCKKRRKMMGRGVDGGCGTEEKSCPVSRAREATGGEDAAAAAAMATAREAPVDLCTQARKALSERCPFDTEEELLRMPTIPAGLSGFLSKHADGRRKHRKLHGDPSSNPSSHLPPPPPAATPKVYRMWEVMEEYFRPIAMADIDSLVSKCHFFDRLHSCFSIPIIEHSLDNNKKDVVFDEGGVEVSPNLETVVKEEFTEEEAGRTEVAVGEEQLAMEIDSVATSTSTPLLVQDEEEESSSLNWLLASKDRAILTTERPSKKRKLLGGDAGLEQLILLPNSQEGGSDSPLCDVCCLGDRRVKSDQIISCDSCKFSVHQKCYGTHEGNDGSWLCSWCKHLEVVGRAPEKEGEDPGLRPCLLCPKEGGALKPVGGNPEGDVEKKFAHLFCSLWTPEVYVEDTGVMEPVMNVTGVQGTRTRLVCYVCKVKHGVCVRCSHGTCRTAFHPICAREAKHQMEVWGKKGFDNVELRAFCVKHSNLQDNVSAEDSKNLAKIDGDDSSVAKSLLPTLPRKKLPKLRFSRKNKDKSMVQAEMTSSTADGVIKNETDLEQDVLHLKPNPEGCDIQSKKNSNIGVIKSVNGSPNSCDLILVFKKLIGRGKINVADVASEIGSSPDSLEAALVGETSSFPTELRSKIIKWLQDSIHMPASMRHIKIKNGSAIPSSGVDGPNAVNSTGPNVISSVNIVDPGNDDACTVKPLPPAKKTDNRRFLKEDNTTCSHRENFEESCNGKLVDEIGEVPVVHMECMKGDSMGNMSPLHDQACCYKDQVHSEKIYEEACTFPNSNAPVDLPQKIEGNPAKQENTDFLEAPDQLSHMVETMFSSRPGNGRVDEANFTACSTVRNDRLAYSNRDVDVVASATTNLNVGGACSSFYVHPFIQKRLMEVQKIEFLKQKSGEVDSSAGHNWSRISSSEMAAFANDSTNHQDVGPTCTDLDRMLPEAGLDHLDKAKSMGISELSPDDELEGEMLYLQSRLLDNAVAIKHSCEDLICRVVRRLPRELDATKKQRWDLVLVNLFLREVREAKKRGRKERKHKEAQAVLAAAAAAAAASSRNSLLRKDANDEISSHQESPLKISAVRASVHSSSVPRLKETHSRSSIAKLPPEKQSGIFQMLDIGKENALRCDICRRTEILLNRIFVCSSCKVAVHLDCYRSLKDPIGSWKCELCEEMLSQVGSPRNQTVENRDTSYAVAQCSLCGGGIGAFRKTTDGQWVHAYCAEWLLESTFRRGQQNLVDGMDAIAKERDLLICCICHQKFGVCLKCSYGHCQSAFHPSCARNAEFYMNLKAIGGRLQHKAYCEKHSLEQRQKAESQQYGPEEVKYMKQTRVELEKLRLLCERIIKREKLKRDLALCSHDILASRRDYVAFSVLIQSSFCPPGVSSESATTSIDNRSYSGTIQRSDDITVDSTVSGKRRVRLPLDIDKRTDDSSASQTSFKRKITDRTVSSGKQLPRRPAYVPFQNSANDGEKRFRGKKPTGTFHKELMMTSHQASMQNQRLPKGFAYVPIAYVPKEKPIIHDSESHEPREPGG